MSVIYARKVGYVNHHTTTMNTPLKRIAAGIMASVMAAGIASAKPENKGREKTETRPFVTAQRPVPQPNAVSVRIGENGKTFVRSADVTGISGMTIYAVSSLGGISVPWTVQTDASTKLRARGEGAIRIGDVRVGDQIDFDGTLIGINPLAVKAASATDLSLDRKDAQTTFEGTLKTVASTTVPTTLTVTIGSVDRTVMIAADTSVLTRLWAKTTLARFAIGDTVRIYGAMNSSSTIDATVVRDTNIWF